MPSSFSSRSVLPPVILINCAGPPASTTASIFLSYVSNATINFSANPASTVLMYATAPSKFLTYSSPADSNISNVSFPSFSRMAVIIAPASLALSTSTSLSISLSTSGLTSGLCTADVSATIPASDSATLSLSPPAPPKSFSSSPKPISAIILSNSFLPLFKLDVNMSNSPAVVSISTVNASCTAINFSPISFIAKTVFPDSFKSF